MQLSLGVVVIGRNEGPRLERSLDSLGAGPLPRVYVDSGSTDSSVHAARARGVEVVELDMSIPFTAARARNAGWRRLIAWRPEVTHVFFVDGDCEVLPGFLDDAMRVFERPDVVAVCGFRRERAPEETIYNLLCDIEWRVGEVGPCTAFGGDVVIQRAALEAVGGYDESVIAGEDDELGVRLKARGGRLIRIDRVSTLHDAAIVKSSQWWQRAKRAGHAYAELASLHPDYTKATDARRRILLWGAAVPTAAVTLAPVTLGASLAALAVYPVQAARIAANASRQGMSPKEAVSWGVSCTLAKVPEAFGVARFYRNRLAKRRSTLIEYK